jgi:hypothetical protein
MRMLMWLGVILMGTVVALFAMLWYQGGALAVGFFVAPLVLGFWIAVGLMVVGALRRGPPET